MPHTQGPHPVAAPAPPTPTGVRCPPGHGRHAPQPTRITLADNQLDAHRTRGGDPARTRDPTARTNPAFGRLRCASRVRPGWPAGQPRAAGVAAINW